MPVEHPAKFSPEILDELAKVIVHEMVLLDRDVELLDPFAGVGGVHRLMEMINPSFENKALSTIGIEIEPEWAEQHCRNRVGNALDLSPHWTHHFDIVATSPTYGNRMADSHNAKDASKRITYKHKLGRDPHPEASSTFHWGKKNRRYEEFHERAWDEVARVTRPGGLFLLNVSDFIRSGERARVSDWHCSTVLAGPWTLQREIEVGTRRMGFGANSKARVSHEMIFVFRRES